MRKACAQAVVVVGIHPAVFSNWGAGRIVMLFLFTRSGAGFSQILGFSTQSVGTISSEVRAFLSTFSTRIATITTFYLKDSLTTHRGIN